VSNLDGAPVFYVDVEHLPDRRMQLWLREGASRASLGCLDQLLACHPIIRDRVAAHLGLETEFFHVETRIPRPPYIEIGQRVVVVADEGRVTDGVVIDWVNGAAYVRPVDPVTGEEFGGGFYAPEELTFPREREQGHWLAGVSAGTSQLSSRPASWARIAAWVRLASSSLVSSRET
jgi:hypothetical protein